MPESRRNLSRRRGPRSPDPRIGTDAHNARQREAMRRKREDLLDPALPDEIFRFGASWQIDEIFEQAQVKPAKAVCTSHVGREQIYEND